MNRTVAMLCLTAAMTMTGGNVPVVKRIALEMAPATLLALRFALAALVLAPLAWRESGPRLRDLELRQWGSIAVLGIAGSVLFSFFILAGVARTSGASAGIILSALPAVVTIAGIVSGERPRSSELAMITLAVAGVAMIQVHALSGAVSDSLTGNLMILAAVVCEAAFVLGARWISGQVAPMRLNLGVALVSLVVTAPIALMSPAGVAFERVSAGTWALIALYALTSSVICTWLWYVGVRHVEAWASGLATAAVPVAALAVSALAFGESIHSAQLAGAAFVIAAIVTGTAGRRIAPG